MEVIQIRVIVLGGTGKMGRRAAQILAASPVVKSLTIAGRNLAKARSVAAALGGSPRVGATVVDATDVASLAAAMQGHTVAAGAIGPFYQFELPAARAALGAGIDYVSICDDYDATAAVLALDAQVRAAGRRFIIGLGWTPGLTNILARKGTSLLEWTDTIDIAWAGAAADQLGPATALHALHIFTGSVPTFADGQRMEVTAGGGKTWVEFPPPLGSVPVFHVGHPEPITVPLYWPGLRRVSLRGGLTPTYLNSLGLMMARLGLTRSAALKAVFGRLVHTLLPVLAAGSGQRGKPASGLRVDVEGRRGGGRVRVTFRAVDSMVNLTGLPLAVGVLLLGRGEVPRLGAFAPEAPDAIDPNVFLTEITRLGLNIEQCETELPPIEPGIPGLSIR